MSGQNAKYGVAQDRAGWARMWGRTAGLGPRTPFRWAQEEGPVSMP